MFYSRDSNACFKLNTQFTTKPEKKLAYPFLGYANFFEGFLSLNGLIFYMSAFCAIIHT